MDTLAPISDISLNALLARMASDTPPLILDVRIAEDRAALPCQLPGALWADPFDRKGLIARCQPGREIVVSCAKGRKLTYGVAAALAAEGTPVLRQSGGIAAWQAAHLPLTPVPAADTLVVPTVAAPGDALKIWAVRRFYLPGAAVLQVPEDQIQDVATAFGAAHWQDCLLVDAPHAAAMFTAIRSSAFSFQLDGVNRDPIAALPLFDALFRGILFNQASGTPTQ